MRNPALIGFKPFTAAVRCCVADGYGEGFAPPSVVSPFSILHFQFSIFNFQFSILHFQFSILHFQFSILHFQFSILNFQFSILHFQLETLSRPRRSYLLASMGLRQISAQTPATRKRRSGHPFFDARQKMF